MVIVWGFPKENILGHLYGMVFQSYILKKCENRWLSLGFLPQNYGLSAASSATNRKYIPSLWSSGNDNNPEAGTVSHAPRRVAGLPTGIRGMLCSRDHILKKKHLLCRSLDFWLEEKEIVVQGYYQVIWDRESFSRHSRTESEGLRRGWYPWLTRVRYAQVTQWDVCTSLRSELEKIKFLLRRNSESTCPTSPRKPGNQSPCRGRRPEASIRLRSNSLEKRRDKMPNQWLASPYWGETPKGEDVAPRSLSLTRISSC